MFFKIVSQSVWATNSTTREPMFLKIVSQSVQTYEPIFLKKRARYNLVTICPS